jgi:hypothetical protein
MRSDAAFRPSGKVGRPDELKKFLQEKAVEATKQKKRRKEEKT